MATKRREPIFARPGAIVKIKRLYLLLTFALLPSGAFAADCPVRPPGGLVNAGKLTIATELTTPPYALFDEDRLVGFAVEIGQAIARQMCLEAAFVTIAFAGLLPGINAHKFDTVIAGIAMTPERAQSFDFVPYFQDGMRLVVRKDSKLWFNAENDVCGRKVATQAGSAEATALGRANRETCPEGKKIEMIGSRNFNEAVGLLRRKTAQVAFVDWAFANYLVQTDPDLALGSPILSGTPGRPRNKQGMVVRKGDSETGTAVGDALARIQASGEYAAILAKWNVSEGDYR